MIVSLVIIVAGAKYTALLIPFIIAVFAALQMYYLRTSRQMRYLDIEAKAPLYTLFTETSTLNGLEHIRAFGWQRSFTSESMHALDYSQKPFYYLFAIQRWLELSMDLIGFFVALILICISVSFREVTSQAGVGLSLLNLITFSSFVSQFVGSWVNLETSLGALARLRTFLSGTPKEHPVEDGGAQLPPQWPHSGRVQFTNVIAKYQ